MVTQKGGKLALLLAAKMQGGLVHSAKSNWYVSPGYPYTTSFPTRCLHLE